MTLVKSYFAGRQRALMGAATLYVFALMLSHSTLPNVHVWGIAAGFSVAMNFTYLTDALWQRRKQKVEGAVAAALIAASVLGVFVHPLFVIAAIYGHGCWDLAKHFGAGLPFFRWYTWSCAAVDFSYGSALLAYWVMI